MDLFASPSPPDEIIPRAILAHCFPHAPTIELWQCEGGMWEIRAECGAVILDYLVSWPHAIEYWDKIVSQRQRIK